MALLLGRLSRSFILPLPYQASETRPIRARLMEEVERPEAMLWLITQRGWYGGRAALLPILRELFRGLIG